MEAVMVMKLLKGTSLGPTASIGMYFIGVYHRFRPRGLPRIKREKSSPVDYLTRMGRHRDPSAELDELRVPKVVKFGPGV
jgi:hypothetical protein